MDCLLCVTHMLLNSLPCVTHMLTNDYMLAFVEHYLSESYG